MNGYRRWLELFTKENNFHLGPHRSIIRLSLENEDKVIGLSVKIPGWTFRNTVESSRSKYSFHVNVLNQHFLARGVSGSESAYSYDDNLSLSTRVSQSKCDVGLVIYKMPTATQTHS